MKQEPEFKYDSNQKPMHWSEQELRKCQREKFVRAIRISADGTTFSDLMEEHKAQVIRDQRVEKDGV